MNDEHPGSLVIGVGNAFRGDDAAGLHVVRRLACVHPELPIIEMGGDAGRLMDAWCAHDDVIIVDALHDKACDPGRIVELDGRSESLGGHQLACSTHVIGLGAAIELAKALGTLPRRVTIYGIVGHDFGQGESLSPLVALAVEELVRKLSRKFSGETAGV